MQNILHRPLQKGFTKIKYVAETALDGIEGSLLALVNVIILDLRCW